MNRDKKVLFVEPRGASSNVFARYMAIPLLGPPTLGAIARNAGYDVSLINENISGRPVSDQELAETDILCVSAMTATVERGKEIAVRYRKVRTGAGKPPHSFIGGIHATMAPEDVAPYFDQVFQGEGENSIVDLLDGRLQGKFIQGEPVRNLDDIPDPDFTLLKDHESMGIIPIATSRGCPHDCDFCSVTEMFGRGYRFQSPERALSALKKLNGKRVFIVDDNLTANPKNTRRLMDMVIASGLKIEWSFQARTELTRMPDLVAKIREAGGDTGFFGFESINDASLKGMGKHQSRGDAERSVRVVHDNGILVCGMFIFGNDEDDRSTFQKTSNFCGEYGLDFFQGMALTPLPGTRVYRRLKEERRITDPDWQHYDGLHVVFEPRNMSRYELQRRLLGCYRSFYSYGKGIREFAKATVAQASRLINATASYKANYFPALMRFWGRRIVSEWEKHNFDFLASLKKQACPA